MATYFPTTSQRDATPTVYLPGSYPDAPVLSGSMMMYMNSGSYMETLAGNSQQQSHCVEVPTSEATDSATEKQELSSISGSRIAENDFGTWRDGRNGMLVMHTQGGNPSSIVNAGQSLQSHGLSLSLGTQLPSGIQVASFPYRNSNAGVFASMDDNTTMMGDGGNGSSRDEQFRDAGFLPPGFAAYNHDPNKGDLSHYGMTSIARTIPSSKYLKAAQELLEEVVNVRKALKQPDKEKNQNANEQGDHRVSSSKNGEDESHDATSDSQSKNNSHAELSHAEKQELQSKLSKLLAMLDEVDRRYKQYYHQMQIVVSSFDAVAGSGAAKPYTAVALQTISRHFRCLRDAINSQILATRKSLGEQDTSDGSKGVGITRLRYVDQHLRQQRALQQFGMLQHHAWRPQRGLPESSVSILRAWLFEHFLHPYPKDSDKILLARQTGLSRSQVSNWFINARVRLWKPMVEEMYKEEIGDIEMDSNSSSDNATRTKKGDKMVSEEQSSSSTAAERCNTGQLMDNKSDHVPDVEMGGSTAKSSFELAGHGEPSSDYSLLKLREEQSRRPNLDNCNIYPDAIMHSEGVGDRFMAATAAAYHMSDVGRFGGGNGVSLTLGLQQRDAGTLPMSATSHHSFFPMRGDEMYSVAPSVDAETTAFGSINPASPANRHSRFSSSHFLHHFEA